MPLLEDENNEVFVKYELPQNLKDLVTKDFAEAVIGEIKKLFTNLKDEKEIIGIIYLRSLSSGINTALKNACEKLSLKELLEVSDDLDWYDYDQFIDQIMMLVGEVYYGKEIFEKFLEDNSAAWCQRSVLEAESNDNSELLELDSAVGYSGLINVMNSLSSFLSRAQGRLLEEFVKETTKNLSEDEVNDLSERIMVTLFTEKENNITEEK